MSNDNKYEGGTEVESSWMKFEKIGDGIKGVLVGKKYQKSDNPVFPSQYIYEIKDEEGNVTNVGISEKKTGTTSRLNKCKLGEIIAIVYEKDLPPTNKGFHPTKVLKVLSWGQDPMYSAVQEAGGVEVTSDVDVSSVTM